MTETLDIRKKRLAMRSMRRGIKEMDLILSAYADMKLSKMTISQLDVYEALLDENDQDLYQWISRQTIAPDMYGSLIDDISSIAHGLTAPRK